MVSSIQAYRTRKNVVDAMSEQKRDILLKEATYQSTMLKNLRIWVSLLWTVSGIGVLLVWWGYNTNPISIIPMIIGAILGIGALIAILIIRKVIEVGQLNVEKILADIEKV